MQNAGTGHLEGCFPGRLGSEISSVVCLIHLRMPANQKHIRHIYWFSYYNLDEPSVRYRARFPLEELQARWGISYALIIPGYDLKNLIAFFLQYFGVLFFRKKDSVIVFQKIFTNGIYANALKVLLFFRRKDTLYDIDDAEYVRRPAETMHHFMKYCTACSGGSEALVDYLRKFNRRVFLLTSPVIDHGLFPKSGDKSPAGPLTVGWIGYYGAHRQNLKTLLFPAIRQLPFPVVLHLLGVNGREEMEEIQTFFQGCSHLSLLMPQEIEWLDEHSVYASLCTFDLGVAPLLDTEFNRAKSAFKLKQYLSCGIPALASPVGENNRFVRHGVNGFVCHTADDFRDQFIAFRNLPEAPRQELSDQARSSFPSFSVMSYCETLVGFLAKLS